MNRYNLLLCLLEPVIECRVWNVVTNAERVDGNSFGFALSLVEEPQSFKVFFAKHNLSSFKFSTEVWGKDTAGQYANFGSLPPIGGNLVNIQNLYLF